jgi:hypothetical protein
MKHVLAIESAKKAETRIRLIEKAWPCYGTRSRQGAVRPAPRFEAIPPDIFQRITPAMARDELSAWVESWLVAEHPRVSRASPHLACAARRGETEHYGHRCRTWISPEADAPVAPPPASAPAAWHTCALSWTDSAEHQRMAARTATK